VAITTYSELKTAVANWLGRADLTDRDAECIALAEARIYQQAAKRGGIIGMEKSTTVTITASTETATVPSDFIKAIAFRLDQTHPLDQQSLPQLQLVSDTPDVPRFFAVAGGTSPKFYFRPIPDGNYTATLVYVAKFPALSVSNTSNWLLENARQCPTQAIGCWKTRQTLTCTALALRRADCFVTTRQHKEQRRCLMKRWTAF